MDPTALPSLAGGGVLVAVILYLLKFISAQQERTDKAQDAAVTRAEERARAAEARADELEEKLAEIRDPGRAAYRRHRAALDRAQLEGRTDDPR